MDRLDPIYLPHPPKTWLVESILATIFCCLPFGIAGIVNAAKVESLYRAGDTAGSMRASAQAKKWTMISFFVTLGGALLYFLLFAIGIINASNGF